MKKYWIALLPFAVAALMWYISTMMELVSMPNDTGVIVGLLMASALIFITLFTINIIIKTIKNKKQ